MRVRFCFDMMIDGGPAAVSEIYDDVTDAIDDVCRENSLPLPQVTAREVRPTERGERHEALSG